MGAVQCRHESLGRPDFVERDAADQVTHEFRRLEVPEEIADARREAGSAEVGCDVLGDELVRQTGIGENVGEEVGDVEDLGACVAHDPGEGIVLLLGSFEPDQLVEQQLILGGGGDAREFEVGAVDDDGREASDF